MARRLGSIGALLVVLVAHLTVLAAPASAEPPGNDDVATATAIAELPFAETIDAREATSSPDEPADCGSNGSVWYRYDATVTERLVVDTTGSDYNTVLGVYAGEPGAFELRACIDDTSQGSAARLAFQATAGNTYHFLVARCCGSGEAGAGTLSFSLAPVPLPPANDAIEAAAPIDALPFTDTVDASSALSSPSDPFDCDATGSIWYRYTAPADQRLIADTIGSVHGTVLSVYEGEAGALRHLGCDQGSAPGGDSRVVFQVAGGVTYHFLVGGGCCSDDGFESGIVTFSLTEYESPDIGISIDGVVIDRVRIPIVSGAVTCAVDRDVSVGITILQPVRDRIIRATQSLQVPCTAPGSSFSTRTLDIADAFRTGPALVVANASTCDEFFCFDDAVETVVDIRRVRTAPAPLL